MLLRLYYSNLAIACCMHDVDTKKYIHSGVKSVVITLKYVDHVLIDAMTF